MRLISGPSTFHLAGVEGALRIILFGQPGTKYHGSAGDAVKAELLRRHLVATPRAWDFLSIALSVVTADSACLRDQSPDGWTREIELDISVVDPGFWSTQAESLGAALAFLTTDRWSLHFHEGGMFPTPSRTPVRPQEDCVVLLSGGLDSLIGAVDLAATGRKPMAVSQIVRGDASKQVEFASRIGGGLNHLQLNHNAQLRRREEASQRARSLAFISFGVLGATTLSRYCDGDVVPLYVCENGFIAINPPLTGGRLGSLSTRTAHPEFLKRIQGVLDVAGLRVTIVNPYGELTKGEMLRGCAGQNFLKVEAARSTSCGRYQRFGYKHCGRCVPCQVRRAAFIAWGVPDTTAYIYDDLGRDNDDHAGFDDVRSVAMALAAVKSDGLNGWVGTVLSSTMIQNRSALKEMLRRGLNELQALHQICGVM